MNSFRNRRRRWAALALLPVAALTMSIGATAATAGDSSTQAKSARLDAAKRKTLPGTKVRLRGSFPTASRQTESSGTSGDATATAARQRIRIEFRARGQARWRFAAHARTNRSGGYSKAVKVRRTGAFRAVHPDGRVSPQESIRVRSRIGARVRNRDVRVGQKVKIAGRVTPSIKRRKVTVKIGGDVLRTRSGHSGRFQVRWKADRAGTVRATARTKSDPIAAGSSARAGKATAYRPVGASWYGPGLYGNGVACGGTLTPSTIGVAHKTLPCGTMLKLKLGNRTVRAPVIDRGPYVAGRELDLTEAVKNRLGFSGVGTVWVNR